MLFPTGINNVDDLVSQNLVHYGTVKDTAIIALLRDHKTEPYSKMFDHMMEYNTLVQNISAAVERVRNSYGKSKGKCV